MNRKYSIRSSLLLIGLIISTPTLAAIEGFQFKNPNGNDINLTANTVDYLNPNGNVEVVVSGGLDRKIRIELLSGSSLVFTSDSAVIDIGDRISFKSKEFYGKKIPIPFNSDGEYTLKVSLLSVSNQVIDIWQQPVFVDTTAPSISTSFNYLFNSFASGSINVFGKHNFKEFSVSGLSDNENGSGISHAEFIAQPVDKSTPSISTPALFDSSANKAQVTSFPSQLFPINKTKYNVGFRVFDKAGNFSEMTRVSSIDNNNYSVEISDVWNPIGGAWEPYKSGMTVFENPTKFRLKRLAADFVQYSGTEYGWTTPGERDGDYVFNEITITNPAAYTYWVYLTAGGFYSVFYSTIPNVVLAENIEAGPENLNPVVEYMKSDGNWSNSNNLSTPKKMTVSKVRGHAKSRNYEQKAILDGFGSCLIPPGSTSCEMDVNIPYLSGRGYSPYPYYLQSTVNGIHDGVFSMHMSYLYTYWDFNPSEISNVEVKDSQILVSVLDQDRTNDWRSGMWLTTGFHLDVTNNNTTTRLNADTTIATDYNRYLATFSLNMLPEGTLNVEAVVIDSYGNESRKSILTDFVNDKTKPVISFRNAESGADIIGDQPLVGLESIVIDVQDQSTINVESALLSGGPTSDSVSLATRKISESTFGLEYPRIFPSLEDNESYLLTVVISDTAKNESSKTMSFTYIPPNLVRLEQLSALALNQKILDSNNVAISRIVTEPLRTNDGQLASGEQDAIVTLRQDASFPVIVSGITINPGQTVAIKLLVNSLGQIDEPVYPAVSGAIGKAAFLVDIPKINSIYGGQ